MDHSSLDLLAQKLADHLDCTQDIACQHIMQALVETGQPVALRHLATHLQMSQEKLAAYLARFPDTEYDEQDHIVGWGSLSYLPRISFG